MLLHSDRIVRLGASHPPPLLKLTSPEGRGSGRRGARGAI
jgi:hypothetical protein